MVVWYMLATREMWTQGGQLLSNLLNVSNDEKYFASYVDV